MHGLRAVTAPLRFFKGLAYPFRAVRVLLSDRKLLLLAIVPFLICLVLYVIFFAAAILLVDDVVGLLIEPGAWWRTVVRALLMVVLPLGFFLVLVFTYTMLCLVVAAPLYEFLSGAVERKMTGQIVEEPFSVRAALGDVGRALSHTMAILLIEVGVLILGLLVVPVTTVLAFSASAVLLGLEYLEYPMERRRMSLRAKLGFARRHLWEMLGFGLPLMLALAVPVVGAAFLPLGVVGGTLMFCELDGRSRTPPSTPR